MVDIVTLLAGLDVVDDRVDPAPGTFTPVGVMLHHTAAGDNWRSNLGVVKHGRAGLPGPLCNVYIRRDGTIHVVTDGKANDSGMGSSTVLAEVKAGEAVHRDARTRGLTASSVNGNRWFYDIELDNRGTGEDYPDVQIAAGVKVAAVLLDSLGRDVGSLIYHRHWTARKIDPAHVPDLIALTDNILENDMADHQHPHPDPDRFPFAGADDEFARLVRDGIYTSNTPKGGLVTTASNAVYLDALMDEIARLRKRVSDLESADDNGESGLTLVEIRADIAARLR